MNEQELPSWEIVDREQNTRRLEVPGGWLYRYNVFGGDNTMCFVPRPEDPMSVISKIPAADELEELSPETIKEMEEAGKKSRQERGLCVDCGIRLYEHYGDDLEEGVCAGCIHEREVEVEEREKEREKELISSELVSEFGRWRIRYLCADEPVVLQFLPKDRTSDDGDFWHSVISILGTGKLHLCKSIPRGIPGLKITHDKIVLDRGRIVLDDE